MRPTWVEIFVGNLRHNYRAIRDRVASGATVCCVVKADAYGHGTIECSSALQKEGAAWFAVSTAEEGILLRRNGITGRILLMSGFWHGEEEIIVEHRLTPAVWDCSQIELLEAAARKVHHAKTNSPALPVHLKVDTGMARLGIKPADISKFVETIKSRKQVTLEGVFTHFASAEVVNSPEVEEQISRFNSAVNSIREKGLSPDYLHLANSAAIMAWPQTWRNMVRPGLALYGYTLPFTSKAGSALSESPQLPLKPALTWKTRIHALRDLAASQPISYNGVYVTPAPARIAVLPVGYADGLNRQLSSRGRVIVRDNYAAIVGNITMDLTMIDVTGIAGVNIGDEVILLGATGERSISAWEHANLAGTIPYEILCAISKRVPRKYTM